MATYKVIQDIEAEDKLLGPLTLRQFIYAVIVVALGFASFKLFLVNPLLALPFLPPMILLGFLSAPFGHDQSSEVWLLAKIRFFLKPRVRIWDQSGLQELVTITVPKKVERVLTNGLDQYQVQSRLQALAQTIDTRGWAVKGVDVSMLASQAATMSTNSDRLLGADSFGTAVPDVTTTPHDDILDADNSLVAQKVDQLMQAAAATRHQELMDRMTQPAAQSASPAPTPQILPPAYATSPTASVAPAIPDNVQPVDQTTTADEAALLDKVHKATEKNKHASYGNMKVLETPEEKVEREAGEKAIEAARATTEASVTQQTNPDILNLANNDDLTIATIARQAHKNDQPPQDEVVISLR